MQRSIASRYVARPPARFVRPLAHARERQLGLRVIGSFSPSPARATVLRGPERGPLVQLHSPWRRIHVADARRLAGDRLRPVGAVQWTGPLATHAGKPAGAAPAPWRR